MMLSGHTTGVVVGAVVVGGEEGRRHQLFTASQWQELERQALIYKYMAVGAPVPHDLVVPLRLATAGVDTVPSLAFPPSHPPPAMGYWGCYGAGTAAQLGRKVAEDTEPRRCRRTDGKKWRCSREAHGDSKYCEKHIHRGKNRSRKPVDQATTAAYRPSPLSISPPAPTYHQNQHLHRGGAAAASPLEIHLDGAGRCHAPSPSPPPSYHRYAHAQDVYGYGSPSASASLSGVQLQQEAEELRRRQRHRHALGADLSLDDKPSPEKQPLRRFVFDDEWTGGVDDATTQLSISMPTAASPSDLAADSRYRNGE